MNELNKLKPGQRIDVFEMLTNGMYMGNYIKQGSWYTGQKDGFGIRVHEYYMSTILGELKKVGTLIIKEVKTCASTTQS